MFAEVRTVTSSGMLIAATLALPLIMLAACVSRRLRARMPALLMFAPLPAVAAAQQEFNGTTLVRPQALLGPNVYRAAPHPPDTPAA